MGMDTEKVKKILNEASKFTENFPLEDKNIVKQAYVTRAFILGDSNTQSSIPLHPKIDAVSMGEFIKQKNPKDEGERVLCMGAYLFMFQGADHFNLKDIEKCYSDTLVPKPTNINDKINMNIRKGYIRPFGKKDKLKIWGITKSGIDFVESLSRKAEGA